MCKKKVCYYYNSKGFFIIKYIGELGFDARKSEFFFFNKHKSE